MSTALARRAPLAPPALGSAAAVPVVAAVGGATLAHQAARAQALLDRIADVSDVEVGHAEDPATVDQLLRALDQRESLLSDLEPVVAELSAVRGQIAGHGALTAEARAFDLALAPVEVAARRALSFHEQLLEKMQAMRDELLWELDRLQQLDAVAGTYMGDVVVPTGSRLDVRR